MIVPPSFLFHYQLSIPRIDGLPGKKGKRLQLPDAARVFVPAAMNESATGLEVKLAWNPDGLAIRRPLVGWPTPDARTDLAFRSAVAPLR